MKFKKGNTYTNGAETCEPNIEVLSRTAKYITVMYHRAVWSMLVRVDENGNEYAYPCKVHPSIRKYWTFNAKNVVPA